MMSIRPPKASIQELAEIGDTLRGSLPHARTPTFLKEKVQRLIDGVSLLASTITVRDVWFRARIASGERGFQNLRETLYPPKGSPDFGRAQLPGAKVLYASKEPLTALDEVRAEEGHFVQIATFRPVLGAEVPVHEVGDIRLWAATGHTRRRNGTIEAALRELQERDEAGLHKLVYVDSLMGDLFSRPSNRPSDYKATALFAACFYPGDEGGITYPSVAHTDGLNLAVSAGLFDKRFEVIGTELIKVTGSYGYALYDVEIVKRSGDFAEDGTINWSSKEGCGLARHQDGRLSFDPAYRGWRIPPTPSEIADEDHGTSAAAQG